MADAPLYRALLEAGRRGDAIFHMPGHKGLPLPGGLWGDLTALDVTELSWSGNLYTETDGPIRAAERRTAALYGVPHALFLTGGATQGVLSMLAAALSPGDTALLHRSAHRSVFHALGLLDLRPVYLDGPDIPPFGVRAGIDAAELDAALASQPAVRAVCVTSPTYYGVLSDIAALAGVCRRRGVRLLVDAAHGAHVPFTGAQENPVALGADMAVFSAHKTLPALGQAAFLLCGADADTERLRRFTSVFGTSSPSYPMMASLDLACAALRDGGAARWRETAAFGEMFHVKHPNVLSENHIPCGGVDPCRLTVFTGNGYGDALRLERELGVRCEMADTRNLVFILTPEDLPEWRERLDKALGQLGTENTRPCGEGGGSWENGGRDDPAPTSRMPEAVLTPRQALFAASETVPLAQAAGRVAAAPIAVYPPGVPLVAPGERIDKIHLDILENLCYTEDVPVTLT
jgi:lysine decarboxylase